MKLYEEYRIADPSGKDFTWKKIKHPEFKYEVTQMYSVMLPYKPPKSIHTRYFEFLQNGELIIHPGYRWDGASGPTLDTISTMRGSCCHDIPYQMFREGTLNRTLKRDADRTLQLMLMEDYHPENIIQEQWSTFRAGYYYQAVDIFGWWACRPN